MRIIPAIDIIDGKCVRLTKGDYTTKKIYNENPLEVAKEFEDAGIEYLHVVDLDGAKANQIINYKVLEKIALKTNLNIDFGGGLKSNVHGTDDKIERINLDFIKPIADGFEIEGENVAVNVFNVSGQLVLKSVTKDIGTNFFRLSTGIYFIQAQNSEGICSKKIFVTN